MIKNYYQILGVNSSATAAEIRRAYRVLARRYHPDLNPGKESENKFKEIAQAYELLSNAERRAKFDLELESYQRSRLQAELRAYQRNASYSTRPSATSRAAYNYQRRPNLRMPPQAEVKKPAPADPLYRRAGKRLAAIFKTDLAALFTRKSDKSQVLQGNKGQTVSATQLSIVEVSINMSDAIKGTKKTIEVGSSDQTKKVSVQIPAGVRTGSVVRLRSRSKPNDDLILIIRVSSHPFLSIQPKGLVMEIPITLNEAISGTKITVPTLNKPAEIVIPAGTQSGTEIRLKGHGLKQDGGTVGDLFVRLMIHLPESPDAVGLKQKAAEFELYYGAPLRQRLPKSLLEL